MKSATALGCIAFGFAVIPCYPSLISLADVNPPGISLIPPSLARVLLSALLVGAIALFVSLDARRARSSLSLPIALYLGAWVISALFGLDPLTGLLFLGAGLLTFLLHLAIARYYATPPAAAAIYIAFLTSGLIVSLLGIALLAQHDSPLYREVNGRAVATFIVPGEFAGYLCFLVPIGAGVAFASRRLPMRVLGAAAALVGTIALWSTYSRAGIFGLSVGAASFIYFAGRYTEWRRWWVALLLLLALALEGRWLLGFNEHHNPGETFVRLPIWSAAARTVALFPLTGTGPGAFRHVFASLGPPSAVQSAFHAHSYLLTVVAETGLVGIVTVGILWWSFARELRRALADAEPRARLLALAIGSGFVATWVQGAVDFVQIVVLALWLPCMALGLATARDGTGGA